MKRLAVSPPPLISKRENGARPVGKNTGRTAPWRSVGQEGWLTRSTRGWPDR